MNVDGIGDDKALEGQAGGIEYEDGKESIDKKVETDGDEVLEPFASLWDSTNLHQCVLPGFYASLNSPNHTIPSQTPLQVLTSSALAGE